MDWHKIDEAVWHELDKETLKLIRFVEAMRTGDLVPRFHWHKFVGADRRCVRREARGPATAERTSDLLCEFSIPYHSSSEIWHGGLHDPGTWTWLLDQIYGGQDAGLSIVPCDQDGDPGATGKRKYRVAVGLGAFGLLWDILAEACGRFHLERIRVRVGSKVMEVRPR
jgi:hypothetical protein